MPTGNTTSSLGGGVRKAGILLPVSSLPSPYGIGSLGRAAFTFVDFLAAAGQSLWQVLPVGPTGYGDSPYQSFSAMAGNPYFVDLDLLAANGLLEVGEIGADWGADPARVDYGLLYQKRLSVLGIAAARQNKTEPAYRDFCRKNTFWLDDYAMFMAIRERYGNAALVEWPEELRCRGPVALKEAEAQWGPRMEFWRCVQYFFFTQWRALKSYANAQGVGIVGDIPIYVAPDSSDLWAHPELFQTDGSCRPTEVAGVPPDAFSADGQLWGNPLYAWENHKRTAYAWWMQRLRFASELYDVVRIDHFRGFESYYAIPAGAATARDGRWLKGPGRDFIRMLRKTLPEVQVIAEDLGFLTKDVRELLAYSGYPGMKVLQFAFDSREESDYLPHNYRHHTVVYTGTHDNTTTAAWQRTAHPRDVAYARRYLGLARGRDVTPAMVRAALASVADTAVVPMQDWLNLGESARVNKPSTLGGNNWRWRLLPGQVDTALAARIREESKLYGRLSATAAAAEKRPRVLSRAATRAAEKAAVLLGGSYEELMENAGCAAALEVAGMLAGLPPAGQQGTFAALRDRLARKAETEAEGQKPSALLLCGRGNNAGDAFVAGRLLVAEGWRIQVLLLCGGPLSPLAQLNFARLPAEVAVVTAVEADFSADLLVDGVYGTGFKGALPPEAQAAFARANTAEGLRVALDLPSGLDCDRGAAAPGTFKADVTLTFGAYKPGLVARDGPAVAGEVRCLNIGL